MNVSTLSGVNDSDRFQVLSRIYQEQVKAAREREGASATEQTSLMEGNTTTPKGDK